MTLKNILIITIISIVLLSCNSKSLNTNTELYKIEIKKASYFHKDFTNQIQTGHLKIIAERMSLKELFGILIKFINCNLTKITEILNSEFPEQTIYNSESKRIDYSWKKTSFDKLKTQMQNDFGIIFLDSKNDKSIFTIENN